ncbi:MAG: MoaD/ThiS family protein [Chlorobi bacterium]|nr:MoaD/ThiS family protein [Chlorobiota bacterium]
MKIKISTYGIIREVLPVTKWECNNNNSVPLGKVVEEIKEKYPDLSKYKFVTAVNNVISESGEKLSEGDEITFIPPFAGG